MKSIIAILIVAIIAGVYMLGFQIYNETRPVELYEPQVTNEQKLANHLANKMQEQAEARTLTVRAELAFIERQELLKFANDEYEFALEAISIYQTGL